MTEKKELPKLSPEYLTKNKLWDSYWLIGKDNNFKNEAKEKNMH